MLKAGKAFVYSKESSLRGLIKDKTEEVFEYEVTVFSDIEMFIQAITQSEQKTEFVVTDLDSCGQDQFQRLYQIINSYEIPCLTVSSDLSQLNNLTNEVDDSYLSFLPKSIIQTMFKETATLLLEKTTPGHKLQKRIKDFSLLKRPKLLYLVALTLFCEPLMKVLYLKYSTGFTWDTIFRTIFSIEGAIANFEFWFLFPIAGYALYAVRSWSFFFFIGLQAYTVYSFATYEEFTWPFVAETPHISNNFMLFFNLLLIGYFLTPERRRPFWNKAQRLWRDSTRYATNIKTHVKGTKKPFEATITNISKSGAYFTSQENIQVGDTMQLSLKIGGRNLDLHAKVRRVQGTAHESFYGYGVEFFKIPRKEREFIQDYVSGLIHRIQ